MGSYNKWRRWIYPLLFECPFSWIPTASLTPMGGPGQERQGAAGFGGCWPQIPTSRTRGLKRLVHPGEWNLGAWGPGRGFLVLVGLGNLTPAEEGYIVEVTRHPWSERSQSDSGESPPQQGQIGESKILSWDSVGWILALIRTSRWVNPCHLWQLCMYYCLLYVTHFSAFSK